MIEPLRFHNIPVPKERIKCFACGKALMDQEGNFIAGYNLGVIDGVILMACKLHSENTEIMRESIKDIIELDRAMGLTGRLIIK